MHDEKQQAGKILNYAVPDKEDESIGVAFWVLLALTIWLVGVLFLTPGPGHEPEIWTLLKSAPGALIPWLFLFRGEMRAWAILLLLLNVPLFVMTCLNIINHL